MKIAPPASPHVPRRPLAQGIGVDIARILGERGRRRRGDIEPCLLEVRPAGSFSSASNHGGLTSATRSTPAFCRGARGQDRNAGQQREPQGQGGFGVEPQCIRELVER